MPDSAKLSARKQGMVPRRRWQKVPGIALLCMLSFAAVAQKKNLPQPDELKKLSFEELMNLEVTSVSKGPEKLSEVASAIQVVTGEDIRRSAATRLPSALRLAPNLQVAMANSHDWGITARGFNGAPLGNNTLANKLLVMIDGRTVYTPLFGGVTWDAQNVMLEDVDRIEVVSGPGGTLWGANAVNGVINVISKPAKQTQGLYVSEIAGDFLKFYGGVRYGGRIDSGLYCRVYMQHFTQGNTRLASGADARDRWSMNQGGFRLDYERNPKDMFTLQGDIYGGTEDTSSILIDGQNLLGRWTHTFSQSSNLVVQGYFDRTYRNFVFSRFIDELTTYDLDFQHALAIRSRHRVLWGAGYRAMDDKTQGSQVLFFTPSRRTLQLFSAFIQDQIAIVPKRLDLTIGTKLQHNDYTGWEVQPSIRMAWTPSAKHTVWGAVSRAVRTPSRFDNDEHLQNTISTPSGDFRSEEVVAYELGYRGHPNERVTFSLSAFYNDYEHLRTIDTNQGPGTFLIFANNQNATSYGLELSWNAYVLKWWRVRGGFTLLQKEFTITGDHTYERSDLVEALDPSVQVVLHSIMDLPANLQFDVAIRYVDMLPAISGSAVPSYVIFDARLAWVYKRFTFSIAGQNQGQSWHREFGTRQIPANFYQRISFRI